jgi:hypothetical protein
MARSRDYTELARVVRAVISDLSVARQLLNSLTKHARASPRHEEDAHDAVLVLDQDYA